MGQLIGRVLIGSLPVVLFLFALIYLDSYKLIKLRSVLATIAFGGIVAMVAYLANSRLSGALTVSPESYSRYVAPLIEETAKALFIIYLLRSNRVGFLVDAAIYGFALGTGFSLVENLYYVRILPDANLVVWLVRGCGTAIMHGGATAIFAVASKSLSERAGVPVLASYAPGLAIAYAIHSAFNHFFLSPVVSAMGVMIVLPAMMFFVFDRSEKATRQWLDVGFDADTELLELIESGELSQSHVGIYLHSLKEKFKGEVVADLICYLRIHVELSLRAKGLMMLRQSGFKVAPDEPTREKFAELKYLEKSIGMTGKLAMAPFLRMSSKDLWQLYMLET